VIPPHPSEIGSSIASDNHYDQVAMLPATTRASSHYSAVFPDLWKALGDYVFKGYLPTIGGITRPMW